MVQIDHDSVVPNAQGLNMAMKQMRISVSLSANLCSLGSLVFFLTFLGGIFSSLARLFGCVVLRKCFPFLFGELGVSCIVAA